MKRIKREIVKTYCIGLRPSMQERLKKISVHKGITFSALMSIICSEYLDKVNKES